jgi:DNA-binding PadR family transcriptional regulator
MGRNAKKPPSISATESLVIDLVGKDERYGLELIALSGHKLKRGTIYVTLSRMEQKGFITSRQEEPNPAAIGLPRRMYQVTPFGIQVQKAYKALSHTLALKPAVAR